MKIGAALIFLLLPASAQTIAEAAQVHSVLSLAAGPGNKRLTCSVFPIPPVLNFGLRLQSGYVFHLPVDQFTGSGHTLTVLTSITPGLFGTPVYLLDRIELTANRPTDRVYTGGGSFFLGEGGYHVVWLIVDDAGRSCRQTWDLDAALSREDSHLKLTIPSGAVEGLSLRAPSPPVGSTKRFTILLDAAPLVPARIAAGLTTADQLFLLGTLSALLERLPTQAVRLVVFSLDQQKILLRREQFRLADTGQIAALLDEIQAQIAKTDIEKLRNRTGHLDLLLRLINGELRANPLSDAVIFFGPRERFTTKLPPTALAESRAIVPRFFFLAYRAPLSQRLARHYDPCDTNRAYGCFGVRSLPGIASSAEVTEAPNPGALQEALGTVIPDSPPPDPTDTLTKAMHQLKGKTISISSPAEFERAITEIGKQVQ